MNDYPECPIDPPEPGMCLECLGEGCDECHDTGCCDVSPPVYSDHDEG